jgi:protein CWC15
MTTAHRPTWNAAIGSKDQGGNRSIAPSKAFSSRDLPGHTKLKVRQAGQNTREEVESRNLLAELEARDTRKRKRDEGDEEEESEAVNRTFLGAPGEEDDVRPSKYRKVAFDFSQDADDADSDSSSYVFLSTVL